MDRDRLWEIIRSWNLYETLPRESPHGLDDIVWLVGEVERLRRDAQSYEEAMEKVHQAEEMRDSWKRRYDSLSWQVRKQGCARGEYGKLEKGCGSCGLCLLRVSNSDLDSYQRDAERTADKSQHPDARLAISALGVAGEAGEVADLVKKWVGHGHDRNLEQLVKELGDVLWYVADIASTHSVKLSEVASKNISKLRERYPEGFSSERSRNRTEDL